MVYRCGGAAAAITLAAVHFCAASPCADVNHRLSHERKEVLESALAKQTGFTRVDVVGSMQYHGWYIVDIEPDSADGQSLFYSDDPIRGHAVTTWAGFAMTTEQEDVRQWVLLTAPHIPPQLARCFAWHITPGHDRW
jgi:hypothetical protein